MIEEELTRHGFHPAAILHWQVGTIDFSFQSIDAEHWHARHLIYVYVDLAQNRFLYVGHTGQEFRARFADYRRWLNRQRMHDNNTPILRKWLDYLAKCEPSKIQVWVKASSAEKKERELEEEMWIQHFAPVLNKK